MKMVFADGTQEKMLLKTMRGRSREIDRNVTAAVSEILAGIRERGDEAVREYTFKFDGSARTDIELTKEEIKKGGEACPAAVTASLRRAAENIWDYHGRQKQQSWLVSKEDGVLLGQRVRALKRVGVYVPGGKAAYPSTVLMNIIPAKVAGVEEIVMVTPPDKKGEINPNILAAAGIAGADRVFAVGGAQAVAALAYGTGSIPKVDKIVGPGNIYVATAKKLLYGEVDIDMIAGPSEILILADETANPEYLAADLMSQAEHDVMASAILVTVSKEVAEKTLNALETQLKTLSRKETIAKSLEDFGAIIVCSVMDDCINLANEIAPEHLELMVAHPFDFLGRIDNAGSVFLGRYAPEPLGDYFAGPNHVLPTNGTARFFSPLSTDAFIKKSSFIYYTQKALEKGKDDIITLAGAEGLTAHANSVKVRFENG